MIVLRSSQINRDGRRRYYVDLKENRRGRFVRASQVTLASGHRVHCSIPVPQGVQLTLDALNELLRPYAPTLRTHTHAHTRAAFHPPFGDFAVPLPT